MFYRQPPVGQRIRLATGTSEDGLFAPFVPRFYASGTAALAAALQAAVRLHGSRAPEVILPAYGCPDLVSAAVYAGARPVLVDLAPERPWMDTGRVAAAVNRDTVAIVAVDLFGIPERLAELRALAEPAGALLVEDSAQSFPVGSCDDFWQGDLVVLSFGRGKPVSLLGGGAVLARQALAEDALPAPAGTQRPAWRFYLQAIAYNRLLSPNFFWLPVALPFLHLGETRFQPLGTIDGMDVTRRRLLAANAAAYREQPNPSRAALAGLVARAVHNRTDRLDLPAACELARARPLLRYPLLLGRDERDELYAALQRHGASIMYPDILPRIAGLESRLAGAGDFPVAQDFAARLLALPLHGRLRPADLAAFDAVLGGGDRVG